MKILVVDDGATHGQQASIPARAAGRPGGPPSTWNLGHAPALDLGFVLARGTYLVSLDVDAFPVAYGLARAARRTRWRQDEAVVSAPRRSAGMSIPCCLMIRQQRFLGSAGAQLVGRFRQRGEGLGHDHWDTGESISLREGDWSGFAAIERTSVKGPHQLGTTFDRVIFHNGCSTRGPDSSMPELTAERIRECWSEAVEEALAG